MKPYYREGCVKGSGSWKKDYHLHIKNRKLKSWWEEEMTHFTSRRTIKQKIKKCLQQVQ